MVSHALSDALKKYALPGQAVKLTLSSSPNETDQVVEAAPPISIEEALVTAMEAPMPCFHLTQPSKIDVELFRTPITFFPW